MDSRPSWERQEEETRKAFACFEMYRNMLPVERTMDKVRVSLGRRSGYLRLLERWAARFHWVRRAADFDAYTDRLQMIATKYPGRVQVVFSVADLRTQFQAGDEVWQPAFTIDGNPRFLGPFEERQSGQPSTTG